MRGGNHKNLEAATDRHGGRNFATCRTMRPKWDKARRHSPRPPAWWPTRRRTSTAQQEAGRSDLGSQGQVGRRGREGVLHAAPGLDREAERDHEGAQRVRGLSHVHRAGQPQHRRGPVGELHPDGRSPRRLSDQAEEKCDEHRRTSRQPRRPRHAARTCTPRSRRSTTA